MQVTAYAHSEKTFLKTAPQLLEKVYESGKRAVVMVDEVFLDLLDSQLWTYTPLVFLPHGSSKMGYEADQPIWLTSRVENPNGAEVCVLVDSQSPQELQSQGFVRILDLYRKGDKESEDRFAQRCAFYRQQEWSLTIWADSPNGSWEKI